jgi:hypothetical protein
MVNPKYIAVALAGLLCGGLLAFVAFQWRLSRRISEAWNLQCIAQLESASYQAYKTQDPREAIGAMKILIGVLEKQLSDGFGYPKASKVDLALAHARLARLYERMGNKEERSTHVALALDYARDNRPEQIVTEKQLFQVLDKLDDQKQP